MVIFMVLAAFLSMGVACSSKEPSNQLTGVTKEDLPAAEMKEDQPVAASQEGQPGMAPKAMDEKAALPMATSKTMALTGTIAQEGDDLMLVTDLGDYVIAGQDLSGMVGKTVNVTGAVQESGGQYTINVISVSEQ